MSTRSRTPSVPGYERMRRGGRQRFAARRFSGSRRRGSRRSWRVDAYHQKKAAIRRQRKRSDSDCCTGSGRPVTIRDLPERKSRNMTDWCSTPVGRPPRSRFRLRLPPNNCCNKAPGDRLPGWSHPSLHRAPRAWCPRVAHKVDSSPVRGDPQESPRVFISWSGGRPRTTGHALGARCKLGWLQPGSRSPGALLQQLFGR